MSPVSLLGAERLARYGRYAQDPSREQLARYFRLEGEDLRFVRRWHGDHNRLGGPSSSARSGSSAGSCPTRPTYPRSSSSTSPISSTSTRGA
jgi:hypothetical protein